jgi:hypothetical protein
MTGNMKSCKSQVLIALAAILCATQTGSLVDAREVRCKVLQLKLGRLYFSAGKEEDIWPGCKLVVYRDSTDTLTPLAQGKIAEAYEGVSVSDTISNLPVLWPTSIVAKIDAADTLKGLIVAVATIDNINEAVVGNTLPSNFSVRGQKVRYSTEERGSPFYTQHGAGVLIEDESSVAPGESPFRVVVVPTSFYTRCDLPLWEYNDTHIEMSYFPTPCNPSLTCIDQPAPFFVALIPNVSRPVNRNALLTTALRYKIDTSRLSNAFEYESVPQQSFLVGDHEYSAYTFDVDKGKKLLQQSKSAGTAVSLDSYSPTLSSTSRFIRGTLAQAGYTTSIVGWNEPADLRFMIVPIYSDSPWVALREVMNSIAADTVEKDRANQPVRLADRLLSDALQTTDSTQRTRLLERVDRILMEDIGAFPLFRPIIHVCAKEEIRGIKFDKDGRLDLRSIYRLKLPLDSAEVRQ